MARLKERFEEKSEKTILYLYMDIPAYRYDAWLREHFILQIPKYQSDWQVVIYGPGTAQRYPNETPIDYDPNISFLDICKKIKPSVILIAQKSRMFKNYLPGSLNNKSWLPNDFAKCNIPKMVIEEDYHYEVDDTWYIENNINLILQRHYSQYLRQVKVPMKWFPFSVDTDIFSCSKNDYNYRLKKISFAGAAKHEAYCYRRGALELLKAKKLADDFNHTDAATGALYGDYVFNLKRYISHLSCGSIYEITPAKSFEIMSSGSVLFTNKFQGIDLIFPKEAYCSYKNDLSDVLSQASKLIKDKKYVEEIVSAGLSCIREKHNHSVRIETLMGHIKQVLGD